jgi:hypothetical protein
MIVANSEDKLCIAFCKLSIIRNDLTREYLQIKEEVYLSNGKALLTDTN